MENVDYLVYFSLYSVLLLLVLPAFLTSFGMVAPESEFGALANTVEVIFNSINFIITWSLKLVFYSIEWTILTILYIADGLTLLFISAIGDLINVVDVAFDDLQTAISTMSDTANTYITLFIGAFSSMPILLSLIIFTPMFVGVVYALTHIIT